MQHNLQAQAKLGIENYNSVSRSEPYLWIPIISRTGANGLHTEMRYNYEERKTGSVYIGRKFGRDSTFSYAFTPMLGWVFGQYNGGSLALNMDLGYKRAYISVQSQYSLSSEGSAGNFFYGWGEVGYEATGWLYAGVSCQLTKPYKEKTETEYGMLVGFNIKKMSIPVYVFSPFNDKINFLIGINLEL
jgi:hypothetical protein